MDNLDMIRQRLGIPTTTDDLPMLSQAEFDILTAKSKDSVTASVLADSINPNGQRLTTMEWTYPRMIHSEIMTHRQMSRNSASSRAIPLTKMVQRLWDNPFFPLNWGKNQKGMQSSDEELTPKQKLQYAWQWMKGRDQALEKLLLGDLIGVHKQIANRPGEAWMWITIVCSMTNWENLYGLRCHPMAEPHFQLLAYRARDAYDASTPRPLAWGDWHLPLFYPDKDSDIPEPDRAKVSAGRCARVSYLTHHGTRDPAEDIRLCKDLAENRPMHASPLEHVAMALDPSTKDAGFDWGNFDPGWYQLRKMHKGECIRVRPAA